MRQQQKRAVIEQLPKNYTKYWEDPDADPHSRAIVSAIRGFNPIVTAE